MKQLSHYQVKLIENVSFNDVVEELNEINEIGWHIPTRAELFAILDSDNGDKLKDLLKENPFFVGCGTNIAVMQLVDDVMPFVFKCSDRKNLRITAFLIHDNVYDHLREDMRFYGSYARDTAIHILRELGCVGSNYLNLYDYRGERGSNRPFVDMPDGIIQDDDMNDDQFDGIRLVEPNDEHETDYIVELDTAYGCRYNLFDFSITDMFSILWMLESIYKLVKNGKLPVYTYPHVEPLGNSPYSPFYKK